MLLTIDEIALQLDEKFSAFDGTMDDLILIKRKIPISNIELAEGNLHVKFPDDFSSFLRKYDIDNFSLGNIAFGSGSDYLDSITELNKEDNINPWWIGDGRPQGIIVIALSDPYTILLNTINGKVYAITSEKKDLDSEPIAIDFTLFFRGVGAVFLKACPRNEVANLVSSKNTDFWAII